MSTSNAGPDNLGPAIQTADIEWRDGHPVSRTFGDVYFSRENGLKETRYVFLGHNRIEERFAALKPGAAFVVAETGFGTGLNFLATWRAWQAYAPSDATLHFVSVERYPLSLEDLERALSLWPELKPMAEALHQRYPALVKGSHRVVFAEGRIRLTLYFGDASEAWSNLRFTADAWYLDGFSPALNPGLWFERLIGQIAEHSRPGTTVATFTSVGAVRRALQAVGFAMKEAPGFERKRDILAGEITHNPSLASSSDRHRLPATANRDLPSVTIVGAGIAGALTARNLAERGRHVIVYSAGAMPADGASGNPQAALYVKLGVDYGPETQLALRALLHAQRTYSRYDPEHTRFWHPTGLIQLATDPKEADRQRRFLERHRYPADILRDVSPDEAKALSGSPVEMGGLWFPDSGWLEPPQLCRWLLDHPNIECKYGHTVTGVYAQSERWRLSFSHGDPHLSSQVVLTGGHRVASLLPEGHLYRFKSIRGQVTELPTNCIQNPRTVLCGQSYLNPAHGDYAVTGATFDLKTQDSAVLLASHQQNLDSLSRWLPNVWSKRTPPAAADLSGRVSFRCTTHDYQPVIGAVEGKGEPDGLYVFTGLGSKGFALAPLLAEWLTDRLCGEPECLEQALVSRLALARCRIPLDGA
ncbi:bifunctional tRNA (5-methylaminomethyl-2-thiouridine)(34)-methyltransferase MnmD/FAD-dependent 5-carboxymethylaminomethyl-2-thiouridine(34) oxidoreductase MnmC [Marinobacter fonticola]|uniref:bifunctional tRNA (5-methylaminomethyl-2-thiouridine)(34)-methyltransferase MnmD/FAD-dependent 5-carboxymethylaminomethyl-2-thiouridine(34) oxidoreductase MnmC n=1 Tax=Marinobacter fonticola TaxID=2603215 RepID=UPI0011E76291|nr:bifunctional tRNA (5-methylaminomethyl-2-thiouridine)(34)-methyltransferase MnmD/FAD-dependent 5-carboxymethylaminomethyl-2-thiouridine(34) oxidoreductase MnmC [Marinobacter fonticola]